MFDFTVTSANCACNFRILSGSTAETQTMHGLPLTQSPAGDCLNVSLKLFRVNFLIDNDEIVFIFRSRRSCGLRAQGVLSSWDPRRNG